MCLYVGFVCVSALLDKRASANENIAEDKRDRRFYDALIIAFRIPRAVA